MDPRKIFLNYVGLPKSLKNINECTKEIELNGKCDHCDKVGDLKPFPFDNGYHFDPFHDRFRFFCTNCGKINEFDLDGYDRKLIDVFVEIHRNYE